MTWAKQIKSFGQRKGNLPYVLACTLHTYTVYLKHRASFIRHHSNKWPHSPRPRRSGTCCIVDAGMFCVPVLKANISKQPSVERYTEREKVPNGERPQTTQQLMRDCFVLQSSPTRCARSVLNPVKTWNYIPTVGFPEWDEWPYPIHA